jgi:hypothetical protein
VKSARLTRAAPAAPACPRSPRRRSSESGYAYFLALFLILSMITASTVVMMDMRTQGRRQREEDMIWRGNEFVRAVRLYYRRTGHYPQNLDDLQKGVVNIHFLRPEALTDPMNKDGDGKWRFIYTNSTGQIIGSVHYATMQQMAILDLNGGKVPGVSGGDSDSGQDGNSASSASRSDETQQPQGGSTSSANCPQPAPGQTSVSASNPTAGLQLGGNLGANSLGASQLQGPSLEIGPGSSSSQSSSPGQNQAATGTCPPTSQIAGVQLAALQALMQLKPTGPVESPVIGGFVVGVGSTVDRKSIRVYKTGKKYNEWEFIWNQIEEQALAVQQGLNQGGGAGGLLSPLGQQIGLGTQGGGTTGGVGPAQAPQTGPPPGQPQTPQQPQQQ